MAKQEIFDNELDYVSGGKITYTWNGEHGTIGINGNNNFILVDKDAFGAFYMANKETMSEVDILKSLYAQGIIRKP